MLSLIFWIVILWGVCKRPVTPGLVIKCNMLNYFPGNHHIGLNIVSLKWCSLVKCNWCSAVVLALMEHFPSTGKHNGSMHNFSVKLFNLKY